MKEQLLTTLENSRNYTLAVARAMPSEQYSYKPVEGTWTFGELINHITYGIHWWKDNYVKGIKTDWNPPTPVADKEETIAQLNNAYDLLKDTASRINPGEAAINGFHATIDHITHHRGQAVLHLRLRGIVPPEYNH